MLWVDFESVFCVVLSRCYVLFLVCLAPSFRYKTLPASLASELAPLAMARSARLPLGGLQRKVAWILLSTCCTGCVSQSGCVLPVWHMCPQSGGLQWIHCQCCVCPVLDPWTFRSYVRSLRRTNMFASIELTHRAHAYPDQSGLFLIISLAKGIGWHRLCIYIWHI